MHVDYYVNVNYVCNERCVFCASDLTNNVRVNGGGRRLSLDEVRRWADGDPPGPGDRVLLAGGEPTLHRELLPIVRFLGAGCRDVLLFTNGLRLADRGFARACAEAGVTRFEIAVYGAAAAAHDEVTRVRGSFERTMTAVANLAALRSELPGFELVVRLLVSRQSSSENPAIVTMVHDRVPGVDGVSINRLILSDHARSVDACISWADARVAINETVRRARGFGWTVELDSLPLCVFEGENEPFVLDRLLQRPRRPPREFRYLDPLTVEPNGSPASARPALAMPVCCAHCDYVNHCGRVEQWYEDRFGTSGLHAVRVAARG